MTLTENGSPQWPCPECGQGKLKLKDRPVPHYETRQSRVRHGDDDWYPGEIVERFACVLECDRQHCMEPVALVGDAFTEEQYYQGEDGDMESSWEPVLVPVVFNPPLRIIDIPKSCPKEIRTELFSAFMLYWCNLGSAANRIRSAIELLLTHLGIKQFTLTKARKRHRLTLHDRIQIFGAKNAELADPMLAVKWLGNEGSHPGSLKRDDLLDAFEMVEHLLSEIFESKRKSIQKIAKAVIRAKGSRTRLRAASVAKP